MLRYWATRSLPASWICPAVGRRAGWNLSKAIRDSLQRCCQPQRGCRRRSGADAFDRELRGGRQRALHRLNDTVRWRDQQWPWWGRESILRWDNRPIEELPDAPWTWGSGESEQQWCLLLQQFLGDGGVVSWRLQSALYQDNEHVSLCAIAALQSAVYATCAGISPPTIAPGETEMGHTGWSWQESAIEQTRAPIRPHEKAW